MEEEPPPSLKLVMLQGPRQGEVVEFRPGSAIRIGRVVRGNTLPIKDPGISTKHLSILSESGKWVLRDLDSSNGTVFDDTKIPPNVPLPLRDGSTIKIGEVTSILVTFLNTQHNPTRPTRTGSVTILEPGPDTEDPSEPVAKPVRGRRGKGGLKGRVQIQGIDENASVNESGHVDRPAPARVTRNSKNTRSANDDEKVEGPENNTRVTRNLKNKRSAIENSDSSIKKNSDGPEEKVELEEPKNTRVTRNSKNKQSVVEASDLDAPNETLEEPKKNSRVTRNSKNKGSVIGENSRLENVEKKKMRGGAKGRKQKEECVGAAAAGGGKETCDDGREKENLNGDESGNWPDLEKLSLGEWFDFLEVHLPKQIIDATEEMFDSMRQKAERLREYITTQQENHKVEVPVD